jgi:hypothetical protein
VVAHAAGGHLRALPAHLDMVGEMLVASTPATGSTRSLMAPTQAIIRS